MQTHIRVFLVDGFKDLQLVAVLLWSHLHESSPDDLVAVGEVVEVSGCIVLDVADGLS